MMLHTCLQVDTGFTGNCIALLLSAMSHIMPMEYKLVKARSSHSKILESSNEKGWCRCGPEGGFRMMRCWFNGGPPGTTFFLTVRPMISYKLELTKILETGMVFKRANDKMRGHRFLVRACGQLKPFNIELGVAGKKIRCSATVLSGDLAFEKLYLDQLNLRLGIRSLRFNLYKA